MMRAGTYYVGDLCYVLHDEWDEACKLMFAGRDDHGCNQGEFNLSDGRRFAVYNTAYGDGTYEDQNGRSYWVDSGSIGCILLSDINANHPENDFGGGQTITFNQDFYTGYQDGKIMIHNVSIDTDPQYEFEEEDEYE
jgi:hypothetical protein